VGATSNSVSVCTLGKFIEHIPYQMPVFSGCIFRKCIFPEGLAKELPKMGWPGGENII